MPYTNFPAGITSFGVPILGGGSQIPIAQNTIFVSSVIGSNGGPGTFAQPYATLAWAMANKAVANTTVIVLMAGHTETLSSATALLCNVAGVTVVGLGSGSQQPTLTLDTANTATIAVSADNVVFQNIRFVANFLSIAACFTLTTAKWFGLTGCTFIDTDGTHDFLNIVKSTGAANTIDGITLLNNVWKSLGTTSVNTFLLTANDIDLATLKWNTIQQVTTVDAAGLLVVTAGVLTKLDAGYNKLYRNNTTTANGSLINVGGTTSTGFVYDNFVQTLTTTSDKLFTTTVGLAAFNNYVTGVVGNSGFLIPTADS